MRITKVLSSPFSLHRLLFPFLLQEFFHLLLQIHIIMVKAGRTRSADQTMEAVFRSIPDSEGHFSEFIEAESVVNPRVPVTESTQWINDPTVNCFSYLSYRNMSMILSY